MNILMADRPLAASEADALAADGRVYRHYKGGIYRLLATGVFHPQGYIPEGSRIRTWGEALHTETQQIVMVHSITVLGVEGYWAVPLEPDATGQQLAEDVAIYEHLWPHRHRIYVRPLTLFNSPTADGRERFAPVTR